MMDQWIESTGTLEYSKTGYGLVVKCDPEIARYYRSMIPKSYRARPPMWEPHVTVVRSGDETPPNLTTWGQHQGQQVSFRHSNVISNDTVHCWIEVISPELEKIRIELGFPPQRKYPFHITIAHNKY